MFLFAFNLYTQINLFIKHIFTNKFITTPYYIYGGVLLGGWCPRCAWWWWLPSVECSSVPGGVLVSSWCLVPGGWWCSLVILGGWCRCSGPPWWLPSVECSSVPGGVLMSSWCLVPGGWWCSLVILGGWCRCSGPPWWLVVPPGILARIFTAGHPDGHATRLLSAAGSLASESKLQGEIDRCDYSYYQLFRCSFWVRFCRAVCRLKH